jgi:hypothetical protein
VSVDLNELGAWVYWRHGNSTSSKLTSEECNSMGSIRPGSHSIAQHYSVTISCADMVQARPCSRPQLSTTKGRLVPAFFWFCEAIGGLPLTTPLTARYLGIGSRSLFQAVQSPLGTVGDRYQSKAMQPLTMSLLPDHFSRLNVFI